MTGDTVRQREPLIDIIKGIAILLVLVGHVIQFASGVDYQKTGAFYDNVLFKVIYGFHMPLFMIVSGYLYQHSVTHKAPLKVIWSKVRILLVPIFSFAFIVWLIRFNPQYTFIDQIRNYLSVTRFTLWFLWALFYSSIGVLVGHYLFKDNIFVWLLLILASFLTPDRWFSEMYKYTFPCFLFGYYARKFEWIAFLKAHLLPVFITSSIVYIISLVFYRGDCYVYMSGCNILTAEGISFTQLGLNVFRIIVGIIGSIAFISLLMLVINPFKEGKVHKELARIGVSTMGIYCFQDYYFQHFDKWFSSGLVPLSSWGAIQVNRLLCLVLAFVVSYGLTWIVRRIKVLDILLLGGR